MVRKRVIVQLLDTPFTLTTMFAESLQVNLSELAWKHERVGCGASRVVHEHAGKLEALRIRVVVGLGAGRQRQRAYLADHAHGEPREGLCQGRLGGGGSVEGVHVVLAAVLAEGDEAADAAERADDEQSEEDVEPAAQDGLAERETSQASALAKAAAVKWCAGLPALIWNFNRRPGRP